MSVRIGGARRTLKARRIAVFILRATGLPSSASGGAEPTAAISQVPTARLTRAIRDASDACYTHVVERERLGIAAVHRLGRIDSVIPRQVK